jgi:hypothetical protein
VDVAALGVLDKLMTAYAPNLRAVVFDAGELEKQLRVTVAKLLGPRTTELRMVKRVAPLLGAAMRDAKGLKASA